MLTLAPPPVQLPAQVECRPADGAFESPYVRFNQRTGYAGIARRDRLEVAQSAALAAQPFDTKRAFERATDISKFREALDLPEWVEKLPPISDARIKANLDAIRVGRGLLAPSAQDKVDAALSSMVLSSVRLAMVAWKEYT